MTVRPDPKPIGQADRSPYLRDPLEIYAASFATIRAEADLARFAGAEEAIAVRAIHACGMVDIAGDLQFHGDVAGSCREAVVAGKPVLTDARAVASAIIARNLPAGTDVACLLDDDAVAAKAARQNTTRSAAAVVCAQDRLDGAVVVIGNAPTALFQLLEIADAGGPRPAAVFAFPVGFVGAAESKAELDADPRGIPCVTLLGRRGGSAMAAAAFNAVFAGAMA